MPAYEPVSNPFSHPFTARCSVCGSRGHEAHNLATGHEPWTYIGPCCQDAATRDRVRQANARELAAARRMVAERQAAVTALDLGALAPSRPRTLAERVALVDAFWRGNCGKGMRIE